MQTLIALIASLSIPSLALSIFLFIQDRKYRKWQAEKDLKLKEIELEEIISKNRVAILLDSGSAAKYTARDREIKKISAEMDYLSKMAGKKSFSELFTEKKSWWTKIKSIFHPN